MRTDSQFRHFSLAPDLECQVEWHDLMPPSSLSILVPLYNEEEFIAPLLGCVLGARLPEGMERDGPMTGIIGPNLSMVREMRTKADHPVYPV